ncbi:MAG: uracil-DNA glycosylase family protein [Miltoncostaeaceae bacterium]
MGADADTTALERYHREEVAGCTRCALAEGRTTVVIGDGDPAAELMFVGEAPGYHEDQQGVPFVGAAGKLLSQMLAGIGIAREEVFIANVLKCRPPDNRDPRPEEIASCEPHLFRQVRLIAPLLVCTLGNFATKLLSGRPEGISRVHGCELPIAIGGRQVMLYPLFHPAAALYARATMGTLEEDFARIPALMEQVRAERAGTAPPADEPGEPQEPGEAPPPRPASGAGEAPAPARQGDPPDDVQLGLF